ncbi:MAG TPA: hypothetical protein VH986_14260, partial [Acidimicrobiia bacterium]
MGERPLASEPVGERQVERRPHQRLGGLHRGGRSRGHGIGDIARSLRQRRPRDHFVEEAASERVGGGN